MNIRTLAMGAAVLFLFGCASNQQAVDRSLGQAEMTQAVAAESNVDAAAAAKAKADLDSAQALAANGDEEEAVVMADMSTLDTHNSFEKLKEIYRTAHPRAKK